jgi:hypothetical protein
MRTTSRLISEIADARKAFIDEVSVFSESQSKWKSSSESWCATDITEHLFWAEQGGVLGMWKALHAHRHGKPVWEGDEIHRGLPIEEIIKRTWKEKENVPAIAAPRMSGPIKFWIISLASLQQQLNEMVKELTDADLSIMTYPHPISGPLNMRQRFEFLRFHLNRHEEQLKEIRKQMMDLVS